MCNAGKTYSASTIPSISSLSVDGTYAVCVRLTDAAGNLIYGKSAQVVRATSAPTFTSLARTNAASDGYISNAEKLTALPMWALTASAQTTTAYSLAISDTSGTLVCDGTKTYSQSSIAGPADLSTDGIYALCVKLSDASGNITYGKSAQVTRDIASPTFTSLTAANEASDGQLNNLEKTSVQPLYTLTASGQNTTGYTAAFDDSAGTALCDGTKTYGSATIPLINTLSTDGTYAVCVLLSDAAGNTTYGKSTQIVRDTVAPTFTSLLGANAGSDGYVSDAEKNLTTALWTLTQSGATVINYSLPLDDTSTVTCDVSKTYGQATIARPVDLSSDKPWVICVKIADAAGNVVYGKSSQVLRDISAPTFTSLIRAGAAMDGYINDSEKLLVSSLWSLTASGQNATNYTLALNDASGTLVCDNTQTFSQSTIPTPSNLSSDGTYVVCVRLTDTSGNTSYGKSVTVVRDTTPPTFTSLARANEAGDGYINDSEKSSALAAYTITALGQTVTAYTLPSNDASASLVCNSSKTYGQSTIPAISTFTPDGTYAVCVSLTDAAGNITYGKSAQVQRVTTAPTFTSLARSGVASDGYINNAEKSDVGAMWTLTANGQTSTLYSLALADAAGTLTCDNSKTYAQNLIPIPTDVSFDGIYVVCVKLADSAGNVTYGKSTTVSRDIAPPTFTSLGGANGAADSVITDAEKSSGLALFSLVGSNYDLFNLTPVFDDSAGTAICDVSKSYSVSTIPTIASLTTDGTFAVCARLSDNAGNMVYGKSSAITRDTSAPIFTSLAGINAGSDGYVNDSEKSLTTVLWSLSQTGGTTVAYTIPLDDSGSTVSCDATKSYSQSTIARALDLTTDKPWVICVKLSETSGNITYGKSSQIIRDIVAPTFTSLALANAASDGYINDSEKLLVSALWTLAAAGQASTNYTLALSDTSSALTCDASKTYNQSSIAGPSSLGTDGAFALCVKLVDAAGNSYVSGFFTGTVLFGGSILSTSTSAYYIAKMDVNGVRLWVNTINSGPGIFNSLKLALDTSGNLYAAGEFTSPTFSLTSTIPLPNAGGSDLFVG
ncbi:MAG: hypothetical protein EOO38_04130, partial [Cytophagaceae bacterium]